MGGDVAGGAVSPAENARHVIAVEERIRELGADARRESLHVVKCIRLAPDLETCEALMSGRRVPKSRLDPKWAKAYGYR